MSYRFDDYNNYGGSSGSSTKGKGIMGYIFSPVTILLVLSVSSLALYGLAIRKNVIDTANERQLEKEASGLYITQAIVLFLVSLFLGRTSSGNRPGFTSIRIKFILTVFLTNLLILTYPLTNAIWPNWTNIRKMSLQNIVKSIILALFIIFLVGAPDNLGETGIWGQYVILVLLFEAIFITASIWWGISILHVPNFTQENEYNTKQESAVSTFSGDFAPF